MRFTTTRIFTLVILLVLLFLAACSNSAAPSSSATLSSQPESASPSSSNAPLSEQPSQSSSADEVAVSDENERYQGLTKEEWDGLQEQKAHFESLSDEEKLNYLQINEIGCSDFIHLRWENMIDSYLIRHVGVERFEEWIAIQLAGKQCINIYSFADHFSIDLETLIAFVRDNNIERIYPVDKLEARYAFMSENGTN